MVLPQQLRVSPFDRVSWRHPGLFLATASLATAFLLTPQQAFGETLKEALARAYSTNPQLLSEQASQRATSEQVPQALANWRPNIEISGSSGVREVDTNTAARETRRPNAASLRITQQVWRGGRTVNDTARAEADVRAAIAQLHSVEQTVLLDAVRAYMNVVREMAVLDLNRANEARLQRQLQATRDRFAVGEVTRTDVAQAEARVASAMSNRIQAEGDLQTARENYRRVIGESPVAPDWPRMDNLPLPTSLDEAQRLSRERNPGVTRDQARVESARFSAEVVAGELLPRVDLRGSVSQERGATASSSRRDTKEVFAELTIPLYQRGSVHSRLRAARETLDQRSRSLEDTERRAMETAATSWSDLMTARAAVDSARAEVQANEIALEGVETEAMVGSRTVLDVLDAEQELLDAQVKLVRAERNEIVTQFEVLGAIGAMTARELELEVTRYDAEAEAARVRNRWFMGESRP